MEPHGQSRGLLRRQIKTFIQKSRVSLVFKIKGRCPFCVMPLYDVPMNFERSKISELIMSELNLKTRKRSRDLVAWKKFAAKANNGLRTVKIAIVGKYFDTGDFVLSDAYISVIEALKFSSYKLGVKPELHWLDAKQFQSGKNIRKLEKYDGILVPGGFGETGIEGKIQVIKFARENKIPYFGLCYGMQLMVVEYARHVAKLRNCAST